MILHLKHGRFVQSSIQSTWMLVLLGYLMSKLIFFCFLDYPDTLRQGGEKKCSDNSKLLIIEYLNYRKGMKESHSLKKNLTYQIIHFSNALFGLFFMEKKLSIFVFLSGLGF